MVAEVIAARIQKLRPIGQGGMGTVYHGWDSELQRPVALKVLHPQLTQNVEAVEVLRREARLAARIEHPRVVRIYGICQEDGLLGIEMQYVDGQSLRQLLSSGPITPHQASDLFCQVLDALGACHAQGVVHCDLKPANLLITREGQVYLSDFGISRGLFEGGTSGSLTASMASMVWGTPAYTPPEAWEGAQPTPKWDLYALGVMMHEALTGQLPFCAETPALMMREKLDHHPAPLLTARADVSPDFASLVDSLKARDPEQRPDHAMALSLARNTPEFIQAPADTVPLEALGKRPTSETNYNVSSFANLPSWPQRQRRQQKKNAFVAVVWGIALCVPIFILFAAQRLPVGVSIAPPAADSGSLSAMTIIKNWAYFSYDDGVRGRELWGVSETGDPALVVDANSGPGSSNPKYFQVLQDGKLWFSATTPEAGEEPWVLAPAPRHASRMLMDLLPGPMGSEAHALAAWEDIVLFRGMTLLEGQKLWITNTRPAQTAPVPNAPNISAHTPRVLKDRSGLYFTIDDGLEPSQLWRFDLGNSEVRPVKSFHNQPGELAILNGVLFIEWNDGELGNELWRYEPDNDVLALVMDIVPGSGSSDPRQLFVAHDRLYFQAKSEETGVELWTTDGTREGTKIVKDLCPGKLDGDPFGFVQAGSLIFFRAVDKFVGREIWVTDGTEEGTRVAADIRPGWEPSGIYNIVYNNGRLFFTANDGSHGEELWVLDAQNSDLPPRLVKDLWPGPKGAEPHELQWLTPETGIFKAKDPSGAVGLYRIHIAGDSWEIERLALPGLRSEEEAVN